MSTQSFGAASSASGFSGVDGILGVGPVDLTQGTVASTSSVPTFLDRLYSQGSIVSVSDDNKMLSRESHHYSWFQSTETLGVYFKPESGSDTDDANGELTLGGVDTSKYTGTLTYFSKSTTSPYS